MNSPFPDLPGKGEFIAILGPSGCGKSTVLRLIAGLRPHHPATEGAVLVADKPVEQPGSDRGMVFQDYTSFDNRTVEDNVAFGLECRGVLSKERRDRAREWIQRVQGTLLPGRRDADLEHELRSHMEMAADDARRRGLDSDDASRAARIASLISSDSRGCAIRSCRLSGNSLSQCGISEA